MKKTLIGLSAVGMITLGVAGCNSPQSVEQQFLSFVPNNELGAPHNMKYLVEVAAGDKGYYKDRSIPGNLTVTLQSDGSHIIKWSIPSNINYSGNAVFKFKLGKNDSYIQGENYISTGLLNYVIGSSTPPSNSTGS